MRRDLSRTRRGHSPREGWELQSPGTYHVAGGEAEAEAGVHGDRAPWGELESLLRRWCRLGGSWHSCAALLRAHWAVKQQQQTDLEWRQGTGSQDQPRGAFGWVCVCVLGPLPRGRARARTIGFGGVVVGWWRRRFI